ncbi:MAG: PDZ domain-containing protein [Thermodesulfobacteriota bacterium]|nr:PDZ domain-containing protein [Thermodesulfobacteriota bacterium]
MTRLYYTTFNLFALSVIIYIGVDIFYGIVRSELMQVDTTEEIVVQQNPDNSLRERSPIKDFRVIEERNIFGSIEGASEEAGAEEMQAEDIEYLEPTSLRIALLGTVTGSRKSARAVIVETDKRKQGLYKEGDRVQEAIVKMILRGKVILGVGGGDEILTMKEPSLSEAAKGFSPPGTLGTNAVIMLNLSDLEASLSDVNKLLSQAVIRPHLKAGKADGLAISRIMSGSIFAKLGLRNGDIVQGINGRPIVSPDDVLSLYEDLKSGSRVSLQLTRKGESQTIDYEFRQ